VKRGRITMRDNQLVIETPPHVSIRLRRLFGGAQRYRAGVFELAATPEHAYDLEWFRDRHPLDMDPAIEERFQALVAQHERKLAAIAELDTEGYVPREFELAIPPREYQRVAADLALRTGSLLIADQLGLGKSATSIAVMTAPGVLPVLIVTMTHLARQWEREVARFAPKLRVHRIRKTQPYKFSDIRVEVDPTTKRRRVVRYDGVPDVLVTTYSKLHGWVEYLAGVVRYVIFDEVQEFRHGDTRKYKAGLAIAQACDIRVGLSATPIYGYGEEIFNVMGVIAPNQLGTHREFIQEWCGEERTDGKSRVGNPAALGAYLRESGLMIRRTRGEVGRELPALTIVRHAVEADPESIKRATADVAELAQRVLDRIGTPIERMQAGGELDWKLRQATGIAKAGAVADFTRLLVDSGEPVVLFLWHHEVYSLVCSSFDKPGYEVPYAMYTGKQSDAQKDEARRQFIAGEVRVLIISLRSGAGLDGLQTVCRTVVVGELDWSPGVIHQDIGRVHRDGQTEPVMAYVLVADEGSDPVISDVLGIKEAQSVGIVDPQAASSDQPELTGASDDHIRRLAEDILKKNGRIVDN
jgi:SNF2 family DNA or RNA helicase